METAIKAMGTVFTNSMVIDDIPRSQILRYAGMLKAGGTAQDSMEDSTIDTASVEGLIDRCYDRIIPAMKFKSCYLEVPVTIDDTTVSFDCLSVKSRNLSTLLKNCERALLVAATAGIEVDMMIKRAEVTSKAEALILNSIAIAGIEEYMARLNVFFKEQYSEYNLRPRYSPGYGDLPLELQKELLAVLDSKRKIGVALSDSLLMTPAKSVSAIIGIGEDGCIHLDKDCDLCSKRDCQYRLE